MRSSGKPKCCPPLYRLLNTPIIPQLPTHSSTLSISSQSRQLMCYSPYTFHRCVTLGALKCHTTKMSHVGRRSVKRKKGTISAHAHDQRTGNRFHTCSNLSIFSVFSYLNDRSRKTKFCIFAITRPMSVFSMCFSNVNLQSSSMDDVFTREATGIYGCSNR